jgi:F0F1-type ATP synthase assembly protein I
MENDKNSNIAWWQPGLALFLRLSAWIAMPVLMAIVIGKYLDRVFNTTPWIFLASVAISFTVSMVMIVKIGLREMEKQNPKSK